MEIMGYGTRSNTDPNQILRMVREGICQEPCRQGTSTGMCGKFHATPVLLNFLLDVEAACNGTSDRRSSKKACAEIVERAVRSVRSNSGIVRASYRWRSEEQFGDKSPTSLHELSLVLACLSEAHAQKAVDAHASSVRTSLLKGAGNAIVPQVAAEFIMAVSDAE